MAPVIPNARNIKRSVSLNPCAATTTRHCSALVHFFVVRVGLPSTLRASCTHRESVACDTPTSGANRLALTRRGPRCTPYRIVESADQKNVGHATTILTQGAARSFPCPRPRRVGLDRRLQRPRLAHPERTGCSRRERGSVQGRAAAHLRECHERIQLCTPRP